MTETTEAVTRWRNKPVTVEAIQFTGGNAEAVAGFCRFPSDMKGLRVTSITMPGTDGHPRAVRSGDWLVRSPEDGEVYVHDAAKFEAAYEPDTAEDEHLATYARLAAGARMLAKIVASSAHVMEAARVELHQNGPKAAMEWILNALPPAVDEGDGLGWDGRESAQHWFDRVMAADEAAEAPSAGERPCCTGCAGGGSPRGEGRADG